MCSPEIVPGPFSQLLCFWAAKRDAISQRKVCAARFHPGWGEAWSQNTNQVLTNLGNQEHGHFIFWTLPQGPHSWFVLIEEIAYFLLRPRCCLSSYMTPCGLWTKAALLRGVLWRDRDKESKVPFFSGPSLVLRSDPL